MEFKKISIFPINHENAALVRFAHMGKFEPFALLSPELSVLDGCDISKLDGGSFADITLYAGYEDMIAKSDVVYFVNSKNITADDESHYKKLIELSTKLKKEIMISDDVKRTLKLSLAEDKNNIEEMFEDFKVNPQLKQIDAPVVSIFSLGEDCGQAQTELCARKYFLDKGYKVMQIGLQEYSSVIGWISFPDFLLDPKVDEFDKVMAFNRFVYKHYVKENPDIILLSVPNPIMKYNDSILNGLGILPFIVQSAVKSDIGIVNLYFANYAFEYLELLKNLCTYRFGVSAKYFGVSNTKVSKGVDDTASLDFLRLTSDFVKNNTPYDAGKDEFTLFSVFDENDSFKAFEKIENELIGNPAKI